MQAERIQSTSLADSRIIATDVPADVYMREYANQHCEWINGTVYKMSPIHIKHQGITRYLSNWLQAYLSLKPIGKIQEDPFVMRLTYTDKEGEKHEVRRQPDIQVILNDNPGKLQPTMMDGPADIVIEVISPGSVSVDRGDKYEEYRQGGVREYWIVDPLNDECLFYRLNDDGIYKPQYVDADDHYRTPHLPGFALHIPTLWQDDLPDIIAIVQQVRSLLSAD